MLTKLGSSASSLISRGTLLLLLITLGACENLKEKLEETLNGEASPLAEADLPNCSKIITCCQNLESRGLTFGETAEACEMKFKPAAQLVIDNYQSAKAEFGEPEAIEDEMREMGLAELKTNTQELFEPGCRCFLEETIGQLNTDTLNLLPLDCEVNTSTGALSEGLMCSSATESLLEVVMSQEAGAEAGEAAGEEAGEAAGEEAGEGAGGEIDEAAGEASDEG